MYKTILLPIDLADEESTAQLLPVARQLAELSDAELCVMTAVPEDLSTAAPFLAKSARDDVLPAALRRLRDLTAKELGSHRLRHVIASGPAGEEILRVAREVGADLIILASHKPRARDLLLGSTASQVVRRASCSVLVVRKHGAPVPA